MNPNNIAEIEELEIQLVSHPNNVNNLCRLAELYLSDGRIAKAGPLVNRAIDSYLKTQLTVTQGLNVYEVSLRYWKAERYSNKKAMRINTTKERKDVLEKIHQVVLTLVQLRDPKQAHMISLKAAYIKECIGSYQDSLSLLSDLIAAQAVEGVDFSYVIFKAAVMLKYLGQNKQAIEYLEYVEDDPPVEAGYAKTHILAFLILVYEQSEDKYKVFLGSTYKKLIQSCIEDAEKASSSRHFRKLVEIAQNKNLHQSSELWEILAIQAIERCEYLLAIQFITQANNKTPGKGNLLHWMVEIYYLLGENQKAMKFGEKAAVLLPQSAELRNLLIAVDPDKWTEKLRFISPTKAEQRAGLRSPSRRQQNLEEVEGISGKRSSVGLGINSTINNNIVPSSPIPTSIQEKEYPKDKGKEKGKEKDKEQEKPSKEPVPTNAKEETVVGTNWLSKITNSAATAIHSLTKDVRSLTPPRDRTTKSQSKRTSVVGNEEEGNTIPQVAPGENFEENLIKNLDQSLGLASNFPAEHQPPNNKDKVDAPLTAGSRPRSQKSSKSSKFTSNAPITKESNEELIDSFDNGNIITKKLNKPPPLAPEAKKIARQALFGNSNIHFYHPTLQALNSVQKKIEVEKRREELLNQKSD